MERSTPYELMDDIQEAKNLLKDLGRRVFRISSSLTEVHPMKSLIYVEHTL